MRISDEDIQRIYQRTTRSDSRAACPSSSRLVDLSAGLLRDDSLADHLGDCRHCAEEFRALRAAAPASPRRRVSAAALGLAAMFAVTIGLGAYAYVLLSENRSLRTRLGSSPPAVTPAPQVVERVIERPRTPATNVALVELLPASAVVRGSGRGAESSIPGDAKALTFILYTDDAPAFGGYAVDAAGDSGRVFWTASDLRPSPDGTFVIHFDRDSLGSGKRTLTLYGIRSGVRVRIESYSFVVPPP